MNTFKVPDETPQDLLFIQEIVGQHCSRPISTPPKKLDDDNIDSSDSEEVSEEEIEADLLESKPNTPEVRPFPPLPSSSGSDSDSDLDEPIPGIKGRTQYEEDLYTEDFDEDVSSTMAPGTLPQTKNEIYDAEINIPTIHQVGEDEALERVGEVMSIVDMLVIVKGDASDLPGRGSDKALDSDTLLVFDDRNVLGYIYETFGPTSQPFYQVKFNTAYPLDPDKIRVGRQVFHIPNRSNFVFLNQIRSMKGSDASNLYDEEPAEYELDFSDDEAEAAFKNRRKRKRDNSRAGSLTSSRYSTPGPSHERDQDMGIGYFGGDAYSEHSPYDVDWIAGGSRPPPIPYDEDPYGQDYGTASNMRLTAGGTDSRGRMHAHDTKKLDPNSGHGRGRGRPSASRGRGRGDHQYHRQGTSRHNIWPSHEAAWMTTGSSQPPSVAGPIMGQYVDKSASCSQVYNIPETWGFQPQQFPTSPPNYPQSIVQPHINPRFAPMFGINVGSTPQPYVPFGRSADMGRDRTQDGWTEEWTIHRSDNDGCYPE